MEKGKVVPIEDRVPKLKQQRKQKTNRIFVIYVIIFFILIVSILYFQSSLSKISDIAVKGNHYVKDAKIIELSNLTKETSFWKVKLSHVEKKIRTSKEIKTVKLNRKFPNRMEIFIDEYARVAYLMEESVVYPILENGIFLDQVDYLKVQGDAPLLIGWQNGEELQEMAAELTKVPTSILNTISSIHLKPKDSNPYHITIYMNDGFQVSTSIRDFSKKIKNYPSIVSKIPEGKKGIIDLEVGAYFKPYKNEEEENNETSR